MVLSDMYKNVSVSTDTLNSRHLWVAFVDFLESVGVELGEDLLMVTDDTVDDVVDILFDMIDEISPKGCYFGAHIGDGSDFGFWEYEDDDDEDD